MHADTLDAIFRKCLQSPHCDHTITIIYHAGEPLTIPKSFYGNARRLAEIHSQPQVKHSHYIQTNGTLITQEWCNFILENQFKIGVSLDGPEYLHNQQRRTRSGRGTFKDVMRGIRLLQLNGIQFSVLSVVTKETLLHAKDFHDFFHDNGIKRIGLNIEEIENANCTSSLSNALLDEYYQFLSVLWDLCETSGMKVREFELAKNTLSAHASGVFHPELDPLHSLSFGVDGNFTAFAPELLGADTSQHNGFLIGNINETSLEDVIQGSVYQAIAQEIQAGVENCRRECSFFTVCGGGSASNKFFEHGSFNSTQTMYCSFQVKALMAVVTRKLAQQLAK